MNRNPLRLAAAALAAGLLLCAAARAADDRLLDLVRPDAVAVLYVRDLDALRGAAAGHPLGRMWADREVQDYLRPLLELPLWDDLSASCRADTGLSPAELAALGRGCLLVELGAVPSFDAGGEPLVLPLLLIAETGGQAAEIERLLLGGGDEAPRQTEEFQDKTIHLIPLPDGGEEEQASGGPAAGGEEQDVAVAEEGGDAGRPARPRLGGSYGWTIADGLLLLGETGELKRHLARMGAGDAEGFASSPVARAAARRMPEAQVLLAVNFHAAYPRLVEELEKAAARRAEATGQPPFGGMPPADFLRLLGIDSLEGLYAAGVVGAEATETDAGIVLNGSHGIFDLLALEPGTPVPPDFVTTRWLLSMVTQVDLPGCIGRLEALLRGTSPVIGPMIDAQTAQLAESTGVDVRRDILAAIGPGLVFGQVSPSPAGDIPDEKDIGVVLALPLSDSERLDRALSLLMPPDDPGNPFERREYLGATLNVLRGGGGEQAGFCVSYAITPRQLFIGLGPGGILETVLQDLNGSGDRLRSDARYNEAVSHLPDASAAVSFSDSRRLIAATLPRMLDAFEDGIRRFLALQQKQGGGEGAENFQFGPRPDPRRLARYWDYESGGMSATPEGWFVHGYLKHPAAEADEGMKKE